MSSFTVNKQGKVKFFRNAVATPMFLEEHGVLAVTKGEMLDVVKSQSQNGALRLYVVSGCQLRMADQHTMPDRHTVVRLVPNTRSADTMAQWRAERPYEQEGDQLYARDQATSEGVRPLLDACTIAAQAAGLRPTACDWFTYFVENTFFGSASWQEFTQYGVRRPPRSFGRAPSTIQHQLNQLQRRDIMRYETLPQDAGVYLRFNRQFLPGLDFGKLPLFFDTFLY